MSERGRPRSFDRDVALRRAMEVFWARGYDAASLSGLKKAMGVNGPSLYAAFGSKENLFREAVELYLATDSGGVWETLNNSVTARESVERFLRASAESFTQRGRPRGCLVIFGALLANDTNTKIHDELKQRRGARLALIRDRLRRAVEERELPAFVDFDSSARFFVSVQQGMAIQARDGASREALMGIVEVTMANWDQLLSAPTKHAEG